MSSYIDEIKKRYSTFPHSRPSTKVKIYQMEDIHKKIAASIVDLPLTLEEVLDEPLFSDYGLYDIATGTFSIGALTLYIGSWVLAGKQFPFLLRADFKERLKQKEKNPGKSRKTKLEE